MKPLLKDPAFTIMEQLLDESWKLANPVDWFYSIFCKPKGKWLWCPPLALEKVVVEQLCEVKLIFPKSQHVVVCPTLMKGKWRKLLGKIANFMFNFAAGSSVWESAMFERLTFYFDSPLCDSRPWKVSRIQSGEVEKTSV